VKRFVSTPGPGVFFNYTVKVLLTFAVVFVFWLALNLIVKVQAVFLASHLGRGVTANVLFVDAGMQVMGL